MKKIAWRFVHIIMTVLLVLVGAGGGQAGELLIKNGQTIAFLGDSITESGWMNPTGYVRLTAAGLKANGIKANIIPAGVSGNKSDQMSKRLDKDVINKKPDWMILSCGINDVWHGATGILLTPFKVNITSIVDRCQKAGVNVVVLTTTVIGEDLDNDFNRRLAPYNGFLRSLSKEKGLVLVDLNAIFHERIMKGRRIGHELTFDGVHMNQEGDKLIAMSILQAFKLSNEQIRKAQEAWMNIRGSIEP